MAASTQATGASTSLPTQELKLSEHHDTPLLTPPSEAPPRPEPPAPCSTVDAERRLVRKLDFTVLPPLLVIYFMSCLDRISMNNTKSQGLLKDLNISKEQYNIAYFITFAPLILFQLPSNLFLCTLHRPAYFLGALTVCWGAINLGMGFVQSFDALVALRFVLGIFQAGVQPGVIYLTSLFYTRYEYLKRLSILFVGNLIASAFGPLLAYSIGKGIAGPQTVASKSAGTTSSSTASNGFKGWRWVFILEGTITIALGLLACLLVTDSPTRARCRFLSTSEHRLLQHRLHAADAEDGRAGCAMERLSKKAALRIMGDYKIWLGALVCIGMGTTAHSTSMFMSSILHDFGWKSRDVQVHTIPVYAVAAVFMCGVAWLSDRLRLRYAFIMAGTIVATIGYCMLLDETWMNREAKYGASFLISIGGYAATPLSFCWLVDNLAGRWKRAAGIAVQSGLGSTAALVVGNIYVSQESPAYLTGYGVALGLLWMGALAATAMAYLMWEENRRRDLGGRAECLRLPPEELANLGDDHPSFRFNI